ncbi:dihydrofolate reductase [Cryptomeria japonica]|uniref:dihydrofolate reductase n=1 Tax=Cryptomeria japonica TaxID=3369 RepID=UPI0027DA655E|nr:dihydrofolate reductase [Cryptomeria japonica]XP_057833536.2 dihydrofolate reductase [Cryptomeria japonica]XP_057833537.2 dihydrofolate reductase [Cryptomeria japonica]
MAATRQKLRVLCIHGFRTSGSVLQKQISRWDSSITEKLDMCFLDGPLPATGKSEVEGIFPPPYYEWFQYNEDFTKFKNLDKAFPLIVDYMEQNGPFDGLLGFSQGAMLCAVLVCYQPQGLMLQNHPPIRFIISISGIKFRDPEMSSFLYSPPIKCPSVHITGAKDYVKEFSKDLIQAFENPLVITHPQGHIVPKLDTQAIKLLQHFIDIILKQDQKKHNIGSFHGAYGRTNKMSKGDGLLHSKL